jgi:hypothetical protein
MEDYIKPSNNMEDYIKPSNNMEDYIKPSNNMELDHLKNIENIDSDFLAIEDVFYYFFYKTSTILRNLHFIEHNWNSLFYIFKEKTIENFLSSFLNSSEEYNKMFNEIGIKEIVNRTSHLPHNLAFIANNGNMYFNLPEIIRIKNNEQITQLPSRLQDIIETTNFAVFEKLVKKYENYKTKKEKIKNYKKNTGEISTELTNIIFNENFNNKKESKNK